MKQKVDLSKPHLVSRILQEKVWYPPHAPRKETPEYKAVHHKLVVEMDLPCLVCGVRNSTLKDPAKNPYKARQLETHHHNIEWALANSVDLDKFNNIIFPHLQAKHPERYTQPFTQQELLDWIDHSPDNLWVLCDFHHRHSEVGIHSITGPIWGVQDLLKDDYQQMQSQEATK